ncbi:MAG: hypothetical protein RLZZ403_1271 [Pseudomonadota bacterium]|jgi:hypothetical protein
MARMSAGGSMTKFSIRELLDIIRIGSPAEVDLDLAERVEKVLALHQKSRGEDYCADCRNEYPCATVRFLEGE